MLYNTRKVKAETQKKHTKNREVLMDRQKVKHGIALPTMIGDRRTVMYKNGEYKENSVNTQSSRKRFRL